MSESKPIPTLDGLRAASIALVFVSHAGLGHVVPGGFGVTVFFFLSGYLITTLIRVEQERTGAFHVGRFYLRRALRILPPFYIVLLAVNGLALAGALGARPSAATFLSQVFHYTNYRTLYAGNEGLVPGLGVYWSLAVEEHFYLVFPWLVLGWTRLGWSPRRAAAALLVPCALALAWRAVLVGLWHVHEDRTGMATDTRLDSILFGCILALGCNPVLDPKPTPRQDRLWTFVLLPLGLAGILASFLVRDPAFRETGRYTLQGLCLLPVFYVGIRRPDLPGFNLLNLAPVRALGVLSYALYLVHHVVIRAVDLHLPGWPAAARGGLSLAASLALAAALHAAVERPCARIRKRYSAA
jgi:peptidoglycan/LPS O-acetylase OafA/YrhL